MHFGVNTGQATSWREIADMWRFLDRETKFQSAWLVDHFVPGETEDDARGEHLEGWSTLAALAASTERLRVGVLVTGVTYRNPALLAKMAATVDHISAGRLELGLGAAWHEVEHRMFGYAFPPIREREDRLEEAVQIIRLLFESQGAVSFQGKHYCLNDAVFEPRPLQRPRPPIVIGGDGEKRTLRTLARYGDVMDCGGTPDMLRHKIEVLERHCRDAGRDSREIEKGYDGPIVVSDNQDHLNRLFPLIAAEYGLSEDIVRREMPMGSAQHVREVVARYADAGIQRMVMPSQAPWNRDFYRRINDEVVEAFV